MTASDTKWSIVIAEHGFVFAGRISREADMIVIREGYNVRRWSLVHKDGLGGLAKRGPQEKVGGADNDIMDPITTTRIHVLAMVGIFECPNVEVWDTWHASKTTTTPPTPKKTKKK